MNRPPKARQRVLDAARRIVEERGAGHLTFDMLAEESGVTRGGITYHFRTKEVLLKALIEADIADWSESTEALCADAALPCPKARQMLGMVRCSLADEDDAHKRFVSGMLSAAMTDPSLLDPVRTHLKVSFADWRWDDSDLERYLLLAAADGLFWNQLLAINPLPPEARARLAALIETKVCALAPPPHEPLAPDASASSSSLPSEI